MGAQQSQGLGWNLQTCGNPTYQIAQWNSGATSSDTFYSNGRGQTLTNALWLQDAWKFAPGFKLTVGGRFETWKASDGYSYTTTPNNAGVIAVPLSINQPNLTATKFSPKVSLGYEFNPDWQAIGSFGKASRFPTVGELYQIAKDSAGSFGVDNLLNKQYTLFHPFPGRTYLVDAKFKF